MNFYDEPGCFAQEDAPPVETEETSLDAFAERDTYADDVDGHVVRVPFADVIEARKAARP